MTITTPPPDAAVAPTLSAGPGRTARLREYAMTRPDHFAVTYRINPWMDPGRGVDTALALAQWDGLRRTYLELGHRVHVVPAVSGLPDMVFAANGGLVVDGIGIAARFAHPERAAEGPAYRRWLDDLGLAAVHQAVHVNEGEGDYLVVGRRILAGSGFRTDPAAHAEVAAITGREVIGLELVDPRFYHLDTALAVLDDTTIAYLPEAFSPVSRALLAALYPDAVLADADDAAVLGLNAVSDGRHVIITPAAPRLAAAIAERGFEVIGVDVAELLKAGGGIKCCTLEIRR